MVDETALDELLLRFLLGGIEVRLRPHWGVDEAYDLFAMKRVEDKKYTAIRVISEKEIVEAEDPDFILIESLQELYTILERKVEQGLYKGKKKKFRDLRRKQIEEEQAEEEA